MIKNRIIERIIRPILGLVVVAAVGFQVSGAGALAQVAVSVFPAIIEPDSEGIIRFGINVDSVPLPGLRSYALTVSLSGTGLELVDGPVDTLLAGNQDHVICSGAVAEGAPSDSLTALQSGQGAMVLDGLGGGSVLWTANIVDTASNTVTVNFGLAGPTGTVTPQTGPGALMEFRCYSGAFTPGPSSIIVTPSLYPGMSGAVMVNQAESSLLAASFASGEIRIPAPYAPPVAEDDPAETPEGTPVDIAVLDNDFVSGALSLTVVGVAAGAHGTTTTDGTTVTYTPVGDYNGPDQFTYQINDGVQTVQATVFVTVTPLNDAPVAEDDGFELAEGGSLVISAPGILDNDDDVDGDPFEASLLVGPDNGVLLLNGDGSFTYTPNQYFNGPDSYTYRIFDGLEYSSAATVALDITPIDDPPITETDGYETAEDQTLVVNAATGVLSNDYDIEGASLTASSAQLPAGGTLTLGSDGGFTYVPEPDFSGTVSFTYIASDGGLNSSETTVEIDVTPANDPPELASIPPQTVAEAAPLAIDISATDVEGDNLTFLISDAPTGSVFVDYHDGTARFEWTPGFGSSGNYRPLVTVQDDGAPIKSDFQYVDIAVGDVNRPPVLADIGNRSVAEGELLEISVQASDLDGDNVALFVVDRPPAATFEDFHDGTGLFLWQTTASDAGLYDVRFEATDNGSPALTDFEVVTLAVGDVNRPPELAPIGAQVVAEGESLELNLTAFDPDGNSLSFGAVSLDLPVTAELVDHGDGTATLSMTAGFEDAGSYTIDAIVTDNGDPALSDNEEFTVTIGNVNRPPVLASIGSRDVTEGDTLTIDLMALDPDGDLMTFSADVTGLPASVASATITENANGVAMFSWTPLAGDAGSYTATFTVSDDGDPQRSVDEDVLITVGSIVVGPPPDSPAGLRAYVRYSYVRLLWTGVEGATEYRVYRQVNGSTGYVQMAAITATGYAEYLPRGATGASYYVTAVNPNGESGASNVVIAAPSRR